MRSFKNTFVITTLLAFMTGVLFAQTSPEKIKSMLDTAKDKKQSASSRKVAIAMLAKDNPPELLPICKQLILDNFEDMRPAPVPPINPALQKIKKPTTTEAKILKDYDRALEKEKIELRQYALKAQENQKLREAAVAVLTGIGGEDVFKIMKESFEKEFFDEKVRKQDMNYPLLTAIIPNLAIGKKEEMIDFIYPAFFCRNEEVRTAAFDAVGDIGGQYALNPMLSCLESKKKDVRVSIAKNIGKVKLEQAISPLVGFLREEDENVRKAAISALMTRDKEKVKKMGEMVFNREKDPARKALLRKGLDLLYKGGSQ